MATPLKTTTTCIPAAPPEQEPDLRPVEGAEADEELAVLAKALGHPARVQIIRLLVRRDACICGDIVEKLPLAQSTVSQHLKVLKEAGLVVDRAEGTRRFYQANPAALEALRSYLDRFWDRALLAFQEAAEREARRQQARKDRERKERS
jgi:DNA-binding transcriptional ArsR family regulator